VQGRRERQVQGTDARVLRTPVRVLTVLEKPVLAEVVRLALSHGPFIVRAVGNETQAIAMLDDWHPHLGVIDMDSRHVSLLDRMSKAPPAIDRIPSIALTRRGDLETKLTAFEHGVDDILAVPFSPEELLARVLAIMRRSYGTAISFTPTIRLGELEIDILHRRVRAGPSELHLTSLEQSLLYLLAANAGRLVTREQILDSLWGVDHAAGSNLVDRHVRNLRTKLHDNWRRPRFIATVQGHGYRFLDAGNDESS
jgi:DNA-binding response OmpR family regulator